MDKANPRSCQSMTKMVPLTLSTTFIDPTTDISGVDWSTTWSNELGTISRMRTDTTWFSIDLKTALGRLYDEYDYFALELVQLETVHQPTAGDTLLNETLSKNTSLSVYMSGLEWANSSFEQKRGANSNRIQLATIPNQAKQIDGNIISNHDFEYTTIPDNSHLNRVQEDSDICPGWTLWAELINNSGAWRFTRPYPSGNQAIVLRSSGRAESDPYFFIQGHEYEISFYLSGRPDPGAPGGGALPVRLMIDYDTVFDWTTPPLDWTQYTMTYIPGFSGYKSLVFENQNLATGSTAVDAVICRSLEDGSSVNRYQYESSSYLHTDYMFKKPSGKRDIRIWLENLDGRIEEDGITGQNIYPHTVYKFNIIPIK